MSDEKLRVGILGIGLYATLAHVPQLRATGKAEVVAVCRRNPERLAASQEQLGVGEGYTDWRDMLDKANLDAVVICTPHDLHVEQAIAALNQGLHVLVEKPLALTQRDAQAVIEAAVQSNRTLMVGYNRRFNGLWRTAKKTLDSGAVGDLHQVSLQFALHRRWYWVERQIPADLLTMLKGATAWPDDYFQDVEKGTDWRGDPVASGGGMFSNSGSHFVDLILWLAGAPPAQVVAMRDALGFPAECFLGIQAQLKNGVLVSIASADVPTGGVAGQGKLTFIGEQGWLSCDLMQPNEILINRNGQAEKLVAEYENTNAAQAFVEAITSGAPAFSPGHEAIHAVTFMESVYRSAAEGRIVTHD